jgi:threonine/homoserine/homoserine lactone efflux protein
MLGTQHLGVFIAAGLLLNITPGPDTIYILGRTLAQGRRAGVTSVLGISTGCLVHTIAAAFGLSAILTASALAFNCVKIAGAGYLIYLGMRMLWERNKSEITQASRFSTGQKWLIYRQAVITNVLNPKVALFFLAFLPQFVVLDGSTRVVPFLFLGAVFILNGTLYCLLLVFFASAVMQRLRQDPATGHLIKRLTGVAFIGLGLRLALEKRSAP